VCSWHDEGSLGGRVGGSTGTIDTGLPRTGLAPMAHCRIGTLPGSPPQVFDAALEAAAQLGFQVSMADRAAGHLYLNESRLLGGYPRRFDLSVTDSGLGRVVVLVSWVPRRPLPWPLGSEGRSAARLCRRIKQTLEQK